MKKEHNVITLIKMSRKRQAERSRPAFLKNRPILQNEHTTVYDSLRIKIYAYVRPKDIMEEIWVKDIVDFTWEARRLRHYKIHICSLRRPAALYESLLFMTRSETKAREIAKEITNRELLWEHPDWLDDMGLTDDMVQALALAIAMDEYASFDKLITKAEAARDSLFLKIERRREAKIRSTKNSNNRSKNDSIDDE